MYSLFPDLEIFCLLGPNGSGKTTLFASPSAADTGIAEAIVARLGLTHLADQPYAVWEDPPLFSSETHPACGQSIRQAIGPLFAMWNKWLGDQWSIGDWPGMLAATPPELPEQILRALAAMTGGGGGEPGLSAGPAIEPPQNLKEYDPEWGRAFWTGTVAASCDHERMLASVKVPVLFTHHFRRVDEKSGTLMGAIPDLQAVRARELVEGAGQPFGYLSFPEMPHSMHGADPALYARTVTEWASALPA
jgi:pimeloyl-ACP methyl ester carboxylesterase